MTDATYTQFAVIADEIPHILENYVWSYLFYGYKHHSYYSKEYIGVGRTSCVGIVIKNIHDEDRLILSLKGDKGDEIDTSMFSVELWDYLGE